jgi:hypothetical protein
MRTTTILIALTMLTTGLTGCTGDPDGGGNDEFDAETLQGMIESGLEDFMNNTTVEITTNYYTNETSTTTNNINGSSSGSGSILYTMAGTAPSNDTQIYPVSEYGVALLYRNDVFSHPIDLDGAHICVSIGSELESLTVGYFTMIGDSFTSVPVADNAEATSKLIDGSCDAIVGWWDVLIQKESQIDGEGSIEEGVTTLTIIGGTGFSGYDYLDLTIQQEEGFATTMLGIHFEISAVGVCVSNCTAEDEDIVIDFSDHAWVGLVGTDFYYWDDSAYSTTISTECEYNLTVQEYYWDITHLLYPGLACEHTIRAEFSVSIGNSILHNTHLQEDYEFTWSDWTYVLHWETTPVTIHE